MPSNVEHSLEHAEHAEHMAHNPFDKRVAMTIAIVAAFLAGVTTLSHRGHTDVLRLQNESNQLQTLAGIKHTEATDQWSYYQAKNIRSHQYETFHELLPLLAKTPGSEADQDKVRKRWADQLTKYKTELAEQKAKAESLSAAGHKLTNEAAGKLTESHHVHEKVNRYDIGEVGIELSMVLCSIAVLTKKRSFWFTGIVCGFIGVAVVVTGFFEIGLNHNHGVGHSTTENTAKSEH